MNRKLIGIMACTHSGVIGLSGKVPWRYEKEFKHFQEVTENKMVIMGRKTFDEMRTLSLLKTRNNIIFTRNLSLQKHYQATNIKFVHSLSEFKKIIIPENSDVYMIGGQEIATLFLENEMLGEFLLTKIHKGYEGDSYFPLSQLADWQSEVISSCADYTIHKYTKH
ncbi:MAG: dihydrofolate reductase [Pseudomonadota bacterium]